MLRLTGINEIPGTTVQVAKAAFRKGNVYLQIRDELGTLFENEDFAELYPEMGRPAVPAWQLALVTVVQFKEGLADRQAADAVRARIDLKYLLGLDLTDPGFDFTILSDFRARLVEGSKELILLDKMLEVLKEKGLVKARGKARTDSTHILMNARVLSRLELVGESLRAALNELASYDPDWLQSVAKPEWFKRYAKAIEDYRFPKGKEARHELSLEIAEDGYFLLTALEAKADQAWLELEQVTILKQVWEHHFRLEGGTPKLLAGSEQVAIKERSNSPYDSEAKHGNKGSKQWEGYKVHITESCEDGLPYLITHVMTTTADVVDFEATLKVHTALEEKGLLPGEHLVDSGYVKASHIIASQEQGIELIGPMRAPANWQSRTEGAFTLAQFNIDWDKQQVICPNGKTNSVWKEAKDAHENDIIRIKFRHADCIRCSDRPRCMRSKQGGRATILKPKAEYEALLEARAVQTTAVWQERYNKRAGIEGTISQEVRSQGLRRSKYKGLAKTSLQHAATASATNLQRLEDFWNGVKPEKTRTSLFLRLAA